MQVTLDELQKAFVEERITLEQLVEVLNDNFGVEKTMEILIHNLNIAMKDQT